ncbi:MAG: Endoglucanase C307 precursor [Candidatus Aerophobetes bacterium ADurb.Bin490]|nr:MAG: Endoglucanase C307 precursor [Candidatus Aerophobetes bacterium ADurb.Bin490]HPI04046.1 glycoside hydrolase family 5 protein [Candidatus Goldiibacteriota bacterium]HRQ44246.1 glycoside hydrolase family 5 protein [Candidatus Goldiibacteriota bacterium]
MKHLSGVNLGGFFSQVKDDIFTDAHLDTFITDKDIKQIRDWGFNSLRLPVDNFFFETAPFKYDESRLKRIDTVISWAEKNGLDVILDLHKAPGHSFAFKERESNNIWDKSSESNKRFLHIWDMFSKRYAQRPNMLLELMNEPVAPEASQWNAICDDAIAVIRKNDKNHPIIVESNLWGMCRQFENLKKFDDNNIIYSFHFYEPILITHQFAPWVSFVIYDIYKKAVKYPGRPEGIGNAIKLTEEKDNQFSELLRGQDRMWDINELEKAMQPVFDFQKKYDVPVYCGEFGVVVLAEPETRKNWLNDFITLMKKHKVSYSYWSYKNMDFGIVDYTQQYKDNPNYDAQRLDKNTLKALQNGIL